MYPDRLDTQRSRSTKYNCKVCKKVATDWNTWIAVATGGDVSNTDTLGDISNNDSHTIIKLSRKFL